MDSAVDTANTKIYIECIGLLQQNYTILFSIVRTNLDFYRAMKEFSIPRLWIGPNFAEWRRMVVICVDGATT